MTRSARIVAVIALLAGGCASAPEKDTLADLQAVRPDMADVQVENGLDKAILGYGTFLEETPESSLTPEAMRRLADLKVEKEFGILGDGSLIELPAPESAATADVAAARTGPAPHDRIDGARESDREFEARAAAPDPLPAGPSRSDLPVPAGEDDGATAGPRQAIALYDEILARYPDYEHADLVLYQKARAYDELGEPDRAMAVMDEFVAAHSGSRHADEVQFRRAEYFFVRKQYLDAERAYAAVAAMGESSEYYELALYKLGWALYKQDMHAEALDQYMALLDYKVSTGYDFDAAGDEHEERRVADTFRVISLSFSNLGGPEVVADYFGHKGNRPYEDRVYSRLGEFYLDKLRYQDAANTYMAFVELYPLHRSSPHFSMRTVEIYDAGGFPHLVLKSKKEFAARYGLKSDYWQHFTAEDAPEVLSYLKSNLEDLASHYHALYQEETLAEERPANYREALQWYAQYLESFPADPDTPGIHYRLADLELENEDFGLAARDYERTAYDYAPHPQAAEAGYAAIFAHRENQKRADAMAQAGIRREAVTSTLRFVDAFPQHEHAEVVLGAAVDDLYGMQEYETAIARGRQLIIVYPDSEPAILRAAWAVVANASLDTAQYVEAEQAYLQLLSMTPADDELRQGVVDNLAASIYKQGEASVLLGDERGAADHYLRIRELAPDSAIRPAAEYDAAAALMRVQDWMAAAAVLESFRQAFPDHELHGDATKQIAYVYREDGQLARAADEYVQVADDASDPELRREALLEAGDLYEKSESVARAMDVYLVYVAEFPQPAEMAIEIHYKLAGMFQGQSDGERQREQLRAVVAVDRDAGERSARTRYLAGHSALKLAEYEFQGFVDVRLVQPFEASLQEKQHRMDELLASLNALLEYELGEVTAAATWYMGEAYYEFSQALINSERPSDLSAAELQDYEMVIEEEAFPFEELAIEVHEKNLELLVGGLFNPWIEQSLAKLADLMPGRYAKLEISPGFLDSMDTYAYQPPAVQVDELGDGLDTTGGSDAVPEGDGVAGATTEPESAAGEGVDFAIEPIDTDATGPGTGEDPMATPDDGAEGGGDETP